MNKSRLSSVSVAFVAAALWAADAGAQTPWSVSFDLGAQVSVSGDVHGGGSGSVLNLPTQVESRSYGDVYGSGFYWAVGFGYQLGERGEFRVQGSYTNNPAERLQVGNVAGLPLFGLFDDYNAFGMDFGTASISAAPWRGRSSAAASGSSGSRRSRASSASRRRASFSRTWTSTMPLWSPGSVPAVASRSLFQQVRGPGRHRVQVARRRRQSRWSRGDRPRHDQR